MRDLPALPAPPALPALSRSRARSGSLARLLRHGAMAAAPRAAARLPRERPARCGPMSFALQCPPDASRSSRRRTAPAVLSGAVCASRTLARPRARLTAFRRFQAHARSARLRQADGDRLLGRPRAVLAAADVLHLLAHEFAGLRAGRLALPFIAASPFHCSLFRHGSSCLAFHIQAMCLTKCGRCRRCERCEVRGARACLAVARSAKAG